MKSTLILVVFFSLLFSVYGQQRAAVLLSPYSPTMDSIEYASKLYREAIRVSEKDTSKSLQLLFSAVDIFSRNKNALLEGRCYIAIGDLLYRAGKYSRSFGNYVKASDILYEVSPAEGARATLGIAKTQYHRSLYRFSIKALAEVIEYAVKNNDNELKSESEEYLGLIYSIFQSSTESKNYFSSALATRQKLNDERGCLRISENLFELYYKDKQFDSALWYSQLNIKLASKIKHDASLQLAQLGRIASLIRLKNFEDASNGLEEFKKSPIHQADINTRVRYEILKGNFCLARLETKKGLSHYNAALDLTSKINTPELIAMVYSHMSDSYLEMEDYKTAYEYAVKHFAMMNNFYSYSISHLSKVEGLMKTDVANNEIKYLNSINKLKEIQFLREVELRRNLQEKGRLKDSILKQERLLSSALERENSFKTKELSSQQQLSEFLNRESQVQKKKLREEHMLRVLMITGLCCLLALGCLSWYQYRRVKTKKEIIQKQADELETLMKEIHHRVKNNLQIISSLLDIQSMSLTDQQAVEAIKESRNRVQSMAIIHQHLYHEGNIRGIIIDDYIKNLIQNLFSSYNINADKVSLELDIDKLNLDVDTVIPLGLIINELVSNSLKYAFDTVENGIVSISLKEKDDYLELLVKDDGRGFPPELNIHKNHSFGLQMITAFAQKLKARLDFYNDNGASVSMQIKKFRFAGA